MEKGGREVNRRNRKMRSARREAFRQFDDKGRAQIQLPSLTDEGLNNVVNRTLEALKKEEASTP